MKFVSGLELNEQFYWHVVAPLLARDYPSLSYSAALMGYGSDVLGFDTATSMDHNWGPRLQIFLDKSDFDALGVQLVEYFRHSLPFAYKGFPTNYCLPRYDRTQTMEATNSYPVNHLIEVSTVDSYFSSYLGPCSIDNPSLFEWSDLDDQKLLEVTSGKVFHDGLRMLTVVRQRFAFFPRDVLLLRLVHLWKSIQEDEPLVGRTIELQTYDGTKILASRLVETCTRICMYLEGRYVPYRKWLYRSFQTTNIYPEVQPLCVKVLNENEPHAIENGLCTLYEKVVEIHNRHADFPTLDNRTRNFFNRPYKVIFAETIVEKLKQAISSPELKKKV